MALLKDVTKRLQHAESRITWMNTRKVKLDEILEEGRPAGLKTSLGYLIENHTLGHTITSTIEIPNVNKAQTTCSVEGTFQKANLTNVEKKYYKTSTKQEDHLLCVGIAG